MPPPAHPAPLTVLLLEDSPLIGSRQARMLRSIRELELLASARDPRAALLAAQILLPDVVILSLGRYEGSWMKVLEELKRMRRHATVVVLSNCSVPPMRSAYLQAGASLFFDKTKEFDALRTALRPHAAGKSAARTTEPEDARA